MVLNRVWVSMLAVATIAGGELGAQRGGGRGSPSDSARRDSFFTMLESLRVRRDSLRLGLAGLAARLPMLGAGSLVYGFALECTHCNQVRILWDSAGGGWARPAQRYSEWPRVAALAVDGSAARAGIQVGDSLVAVNGESILTVEGARQFSGVRVGDAVTLTVRRGGRNVSVTITPSAAGGRRHGGPLPAEPALPLRLPGQVGVTPVEVMSDSPLTVEMDPSGDLVIHVAGTTVRVHPRGPGP
jgi:hypothetical protein